MPRGKKKTSSNNVNYKEMAEHYARLYNQSMAGMMGRGVRAKLVQVNFDTLDKMAERNPLVNAIVQKRTQQIRPFCKMVAEESDERGFLIKHIAGKGDEKRVVELGNFLINTGWKEDVDREDDLADFIQYLVRDALVFDQNATEIRRTKSGEVFDFWYVDGTTLLRLSPYSPEFQKGYRFVQRDENQRDVSFFKPKDMIFDYMNKRARLKYRGYGYSCLEQMIDLVTTFLFSMIYNKDIFLKDKLPKGFLAVTGDVDGSTLSKIRDYWVAEMTGYGARFTIPILPSGKDGVGIDWKSLGQTNRDMEYHKLVMFLVSLICAVFSIDAAELGIKTDQSQSLIGESGEPRIQHSKDTGLGSLLAYVETYMNKVLRMVDPEYRLTFTGLKDDDKMKKEDITKKQIESYRTVDEIREERGMKPFKQPWSQIVLNPQAVQLAGQMGMGGGAGGGGEEGFGEEEAAIEGEGESKAPEEEEAFYTEGGEEAAPETSSDQELEKSLKRASHKYCEIRI